MLFEITVYYLPDNFDPEDDALGRKPKMTKGIMVINSDHVVAFNPHESEGTIVRLSNSEVFQTTMPFEEFWDRMELAEDEKSQVFIPREN